MNQFSSFGVIALAMREEYSTPLKLPDFRAYFVKIVGSTSKMSAMPCNM
jgi:hypothetical protein